VELKLAPVLGLDFVKFPTAIFKKLVAMSALQYCLLTDVTVDLGRGALRCFKLFALAIIPELFIAGIYTLTQPKRHCKL
jgi:hypothetical protein